MTPSELRTMRQARGQTQTELAAALGVDIKTVQRWEKGTSPVPVAIEKLLTIWSRQAARKEKRYMTQGKDQNGKKLQRDIRQESIDGRLLWGANVWFGGFNDSLATNFRRYYFETREQARCADISMNIGAGGRVA